MTTINISKFHNSDILELIKLQQSGFNNNIYEYYPRVIRKNINNHYLAWVLIYGKSTNNNSAPLINDLITYSPLIFLNFSDQIKHSHHNFYHLPVDYYEVFRKKLLSTPEQFDKYHADFSRSFYENQFITYSIVYNENPKNILIHCLNCIAIHESLKHTSDEFADIIKNYKIPTSSEPIIYWRRFDQEKVSDFPGLVPLTFLECEDLRIFYKKLYSNTLSFESLIPEQHDKFLAFGGPSIIRKPRLYTWLHNDYNDPQLSDQFKNWFQYFITKKIPFKGLVGNFHSELIMDYANLCPVENVLDFCKNATFEIKMKLLSSFLMYEFFEKFDILFDHLKPNKIIFPEFIEAIFLSDKNKYFQLCKKIPTGTITYIMISNAIQKTPIGVRQDKNYLELYKKKK